MRRSTSLVAGSTAVLVTGLAFATPVAAEAGRLIMGKDIKDGSVTTADIANGSLKKKDLAASARPLKGDPGPAGPVGPQGPAGVVGRGFQAGAVDLPTTSLAFLAAPAVVTVRSGETVSVTSSAALGSTSGAFDLDLDICFSLGTAVTPVPGGGVKDLTAAGGQQHLFTLSSVIDGLSGTYSVGLCGRSSQPGDWDEQGGGQTSVQVFKTP